MDLSWAPHGEPCKGFVSVFALFNPMVCVILMRLIEIAVDLSEASIKCVIEYIRSADHGKSLLCRIADPKQNTTAQAAHHGPNGSPVPCPTLNAMPVLLESSPGPAPLCALTAPMPKAAPSTSIATMIRGADKTMQSEISELYSYLGQQPSQELMHHLPADMKKCRLSVTLSAHSAQCFKEQEAERAARILAHGKREAWRPNWDAFHLADLFVVGGELAKKQSVVHDAIVEFLKVRKSRTESLTHYEALSHQSPTCVPLLQPLEEELLDIFNYYAQLKQIR